MGVVELISSRKTVPVWAASKRPVRLSMAPVNAPRTWPNSSLSSRLSLECAAVDADERPAGPAAELVDRLGDQFLAGARLPQQQHAGVALGHLPGDAVDLLHGRRGANDAGDRRTRAGVVGGVGGGHARGEEDCDENAALAEQIGMGQGNRPNYIRTWKAISFASRFLGAT